MAVITKTLKSTGGDYSSIATWESTEQTNLVTDGDTHVLEVYRGTTTTGNWQSDGSLDESVNIDGWTTGASNYLTVKAATGEEHDGTSESGFWIKENRNGTAFRCSLDYSVVQDIEVLNSGTLSSTYAISMRETGWLIQRCIGRLPNRQQAPIYNQCAGTGCVARNNLTIGQDYGFVAAVDGSGFLTWQNNTAIAITGTAGSEVFRNANAARTLLEVRNCVGYTPGTNTIFDSDVTDATTFTYNASSDTSATGTGAVTSLPSTAFEDYAGGDYTPSSGGALEDAGTSLSGSFTDDIQNTIRSGTWDIGCFERAEAGGGSVAPQSYHHRFNNLAG